MALESYRGLLYHDITKKIAPDIKPGAVNVFLFVVVVNF